MTAASPSRRSVLTALAAVPPAGVPALADAAATGDPDPLFALIDAVKLAEAARDAQDADYDAVFDAEDAVMDARPRTRAGVAAQLMFAAEFLAELIEFDEDGPKLGVRDRILLLLVNAAQVIDGSLVSKIRLSERLAEILSYVDQAENESWLRNPSPAKGQPRRPRSNRCRSADHEKAMIQYLWRLNARNKR